MMLSDTYRVEQKQDISCVLAILIAPRWLSASMVAIHSVPICETLASHGILYACRKRNTYNWC